MWDVTASVKLVDLKGGSANPQWLQGLNVQIRPDFYSTASQRVRILVPERENGLPDLLLTIPNFGSSDAIDLGDESRVTINYFKKKITINDPVIIKQFPIVDIGLK
jgi:hypothetical protein